MEKRWKRPSPAPPAPSHCPGQTPAAAWVGWGGGGTRAVLVGFPTVLIAAGGAAGADLRAVPVSVSVCLRMIQLLFPQLA